MKGEAVRGRACPDINSHTQGKCVREKRTQREQGRNQERRYFIFCHFNGHFNGLGELGGRQTVPLPPQPRRQQTDAPVCELYC